MWLLSALGAHAAAATPASYRLAGRVVDAKTEKGVLGASVILEGTYLWTTTDRNGNFSISGVQGGDYTLAVSFIGYVDHKTKLSVTGNTEAVKVSLQEKSLAIDRVVVTAQATKDELNTTLTIGSDALNHMQVSNVSDIAALLPGGKTVNPDLTTDRVFSLRDGGSSAGNASFGTAVEVDGVRIGNNGSFGSMSGVSTRNIAVADIESVEIATGVLSAEYGDLNSGMVRINTRKGETPWNILLSINPRTEQVSFSKGIDLGGDKGVVNLSGEWTKATRKLTSPYTSYTRRGLSAGYRNTFNRVLKFSVGVTGNIGGMNSEDDPDAYTGEYTKVRDNVLRANTSLVWLLNKPWVTNLKFDASVYYNDNRSHAHTFHSGSTEQPAVHATEEGYYLATALPHSYFSDQVTDSRELDYAASLKYEWNRRFGRVGSKLKAGVQWKATGNVGDGEFYKNPELAANGYRPRPYTSYPYMHNVSYYAEENVIVPLGKTTLEVMGGLRLETLHISGTEYDNLNSLSPRFNAKWYLTDNVAVRAGWGITEKLPSYNILYPAQEYRDRQTFGFSYGSNQALYVYHTQPYSLQSNSNLHWQRNNNNNTEVGVDINIAGVKLFLSGYYNRTKSPYKLSAAYSPYSYNIMTLPDGFAMPSNPEVKVDAQTGMTYVKDAAGQWTAMDLLVTDRTFVKSTTPDNGPDITRKGLELIVDLPEIKPLRTQLRFDAAYTYTKYIDNSLSYDYNTGWSHTSVPNRSYQYVGIYANGGASGTANGKRTHSIDANATAITHIPQARLIISCRLEMSLLKRSQNLSRYNGAQYAYTIAGADDITPTGGNIYDGNAYTAIMPVAYVDLDGTVRPFTKREAENPAFAGLIRRSSFDHTFAKDGYDPYFSANISITKEIGDHVALSFYANNFTNTKRYVESYATGASAKFTPDYYYGLTCRMKF